MEAPTSPLEEAQDAQHVNMFMEETFREYAKEKYMIDREDVLSNKTIMQMVYALEWYDIPRYNYSDLIEYHPYLTIGDHDKLFYCNTQHRIENCISFALFSLISSRLIG